MTRSPLAARLLGTPLLLCACATLAVPASAQVQTSAAAAYEADVRKLERAWLDAYEKRDPAAMTTIVADDFMITFPNGSRDDKAATVAQVRGPARSQSGLRFRTEDVQARVYGETVILTGTLVTERGTGDTGAARRSRYTDTYVRRRGVWQVVASHLSDLRPE